MSRRRNTQANHESHFIITSNGLEEFPTPDTFLSSQSCRSQAPKIVHHTEHLMKPCRDFWNPNFNLPFESTPPNQLFKMKIPFLLN